jgi:anti-sigma regulatory factor (Ser/Thr protein kinase)
MSVQQVARPSVESGMESGFRHEALIYDDPADLLAAAVPFLRAALEAGEAALVAVGRRNSAALREELGGDAEGIDFVPIDELGRNPGRMIPFWRDFADAQEGRPARGLNEPIWPGRDGAEIDECQRLESLLNVAFPPGEPLSLLCAYDGGALPDGVLAAVSHSHPMVNRDGERTESRDFRMERDCYAGRLPSHPADAPGFDFDRGGLADVRRRVEQAAVQAGVGRRGVEDLVVAASELAANSVAHGGGRGTLRTWREADRLIVEFKDRGRIEEPLAGRLRPSLTQEGGRGLWLAHQLCDLVQIRSGSLGTTVRLQTALSG